MDLGCVCILPIFRIDNTQFRKHLRPIIPNRPVDPSTGL
jgi:hypothetical protein